MLQLVRRALAAGVLTTSMVCGNVALAEKAGGVLRVSHRDNPPSASLHEESSSSVVVPFMSVFNNLVMFDQHAPRNSPEVIVPDLATEWAWSGDNTRLTMKLRPGVTWHDGRPFTSADVKCTWDSITEKRKSGWRKNPRKEWYFNLKEVRINGDHEVTFQLERPQPSFLTFLAGGFSPVYPCHVDAREMRLKPIGTGPFKVAKFTPNQGISLVKNENYWKEGRPFLDGIEWPIVTNRSTRLLAFVAGEYDMTFNGDVSISLMKDIKSQAPEAICEAKSSNTQTQLLINRDVQPFDNPEIRRALALTIDRNAFVDIMSEGQYQIGGIMLPPPNGLWGSTADDLAEAPGYAPDVEKSRSEARAIMQKAGYGPDKPLKVKLITRNVPTYRDPAILMIDQLKTVFIEAELEMLDTSIWYSTMARRNFSIAVNNSGTAIDDPDVTFYEHYSCGSERNYANYCDPEMQKKFEEQSTTLDQDERRLLVQEIDRQMQRDVVRPVVYHAGAATCLHPHLKGLTLSQNSIYNNWRFEDVWLDK